MKQEGNKLIRILTVEDERAISKSDPDEPGKSRVFLHLCV